MDRKNEYRRNSAGYLATGGALYGAGAAANYALDRRLENKGVKPPLKSLIQDRRLRSAHLPHLAGKTGVRALQVTGLPLAAAGAYGLMQPRRQRRLDLRNDVVKPVLHAATYKDAADKVHKSVVEMSQAEHARQAQRKARQRKISLASGTLGATALALRVPEAAGAIARKVPRASGLKRLAAHEAGATKLSNTLGVGAIGVGSAGAFNSARISGTEAKAERQQIRKMSQGKKEMAGGLGLTAAGTGAMLGSLHLTGYRPPRPATDTVRGKDIPVAQMRNGAYELPVAREARMARRAKLVGHGSNALAGAGLGAVIAGDVLFNRGHHRERVAARQARVQKAELYDRKKHKTLPLGHHLLVQGRGIPKMVLSDEEMREFNLKRVIDSYEKGKRRKLSLPELQMLQRESREGIWLPYHPSNPQFGNQVKQNGKYFVTDEQRIRRDQRLRLLEASGRREKGAEPWNSRRSKKSKVAKRDDHFIRNYRSRISPEAERGYEYLRSGRNKARTVSGVATGLGVSSAVAAGLDIARKRYGHAALESALTAVNAGTAVHQGKKAVRWEGHMKKIRNKAYEREAAGVYGRGRNVDLAKALMLRNPGFGLPYPKGTLRKPAMRAGSVRRISGGRMASFRGSYG